MLGIKVPVATKREILVAKLFGKKMTLKDTVNGETTVCTGYHYKGHTYITKIVTLNTRSIPR